MKVTDDYLEAILGANPDLDRDRLVQAINFAKIAHDGQMRLSGDPFIVHPIETAKLLASWNLDTTSVVVGILHDTVEKGAAKITDIQSEFGEEIAQLVIGVTRLDALTLGKSQDDAVIENFRRMFVAMAKDLRVLVIRIAERLDNIRSIEFLQEEQRRKYALDTLEIYAPLADRMGMGAVKGELEDESFKHLYPEEHKWLSEVSKETFEGLEEDINTVKNKVIEEMAKQGISGQVFARKKHMYSLYKKLLRPEINRNIDKIHDFAALRVITPTVAECYSALGIINSIFKHYPGVGVSDFIAAPKSNGYQSLHTKVFTPSGRVAEFQIRTWQMHEDAEHGIASHLQYAQAKNKGTSDEKLEKGQGFKFDSKLSWVKSLADWQEQIKSGEEFIEGVKKEFLSERIFVFTPDGDVEDLPATATPLDFAYAVHTDLGNHATGAKVNGKATGFNTYLRSGDVCEIIVSDKAKPSLDWLKFVATGLARREINKHLQRSKHNG